jgi:putative ABC transport system substrate-binding protein
MNKIRRRQFLLAVAAGSLTVSLLALAQQERRVRRIGYLTGGNLQNNTVWLAAFRDGMAALRWVEGRDYVIDARYANGVLQALPGLASELVEIRPDLLLTTVETPVRVFTERTKTIPIVFTIAVDPVGNGLAASLPRPGGNATGLTALTRELAAKLLQLIKETFPRVAQVGVLFAPGEVGNLSLMQDIEAAAARLKLRVTPLEMRQPADIDPAFKRSAALGAQAYIVTASFFTFSHRQAIVDHLSRLKVPAIGGNVEYAEAGLLMSYGPSYEDNYRRAATYVDKILKGANPGDLPIEQPLKFEMALNQKTAKAMGFKFPQSILVRADRVIK